MRTSFTNFVAQAALGVIFGLLFDVAFASETPFLSAKPSTVIKKNDIAEIQLLPSDPKLQLVQANVNLQAESYKAIELNITEIGTYRIEAISDQTRIVAVLLSPDGSLVGELVSSRDRRSRLVKTADFPSLGRYYLLVGSKKPKDAALVRAGFFDVKNSGLGPDPARDPIRIKKRGVTEFDFEASKVLLGAGPVNIFKYDELTFGSKWIRIVVSSSDFHPQIQLLNKKDDVVDVSDLSRSVNENEIIIDPDADVDVVVIWGSKDGKMVGTDDDDNKESESSGAKNQALEVKKYRARYSLSFEAFDSDPQPIWLTKLRSPFSDPSLSFLAGLVFSLALSYAFYVKSVRGRKIYIEQIADVPLMDNNPADDPLLYVQSGAGGEKKPLYCGSLVRCRVWCRGPSDIPASAARSPVVLILHNVTSVLSLRSDISEKGGWLNPVVSSRAPNCLELPFSALQPGDSIVVSAVCEQRSLDRISVEANKLAGIQVVEYMRLQSDIAKMLVGIGFVILIVGTAIFIALDTVGLRVLWLSTLRDFMVAFSTFSLSVALLSIIFVRSIRLSVWLVLKETIFYPIRRIARPIFRRGK
jgi:hypothetical protein